ncbi:MAG: acyl-CoA dehydrogenase family protein [Microcystaceae cyanobacterium]
MKQLRQYQAAQSLESYLGDPTNPESIMSFERTMKFDETEEFPEEAVQALHQWGTSLYYVPVEYGGKLQTYEELFALIRVMSRRDLSVAVSDMHTLLGALPVWIKGTESQKQRLAQFVCQNGYACLAVSEKAHGSDLLATSTKGIATEKGFLLSGEKWPINKANLTHALTVLAQTDPHKSARSLSLFLVYKKDLDSNTYTHLPKIKTLGLRAADISGIAFEDTPLSQEALIGEKGTGLDLTLQGFYVTRTMCAFLSLGAADTALRTAIRLTTTRQLYNQKVFDLSHPQRVLVNAFADILISDCVAISTARSLHVVPEQCSIWSAIAKTFVTKTIEKVIEDLSVVMGARFYLREGHDWGIFQKVYRDNGVISIFDGSSIVNLYALILQLRSLAKSRQKMKEKTAESLRSRLETIFSLSQPLPPFNGNKLELFSRGNNDLLQGWGLGLDALNKLRVTTTVDSTIITHITRLTLALQEKLESLESQVDKFVPNTKHDESFESFEQAKKYCVLHAAAACLQMWLANRTELGTFFAQGEWLIVCLDRLLSSLEKTEETVPEQYVTNMAQEIIQRHQNQQIFSVVPFQLAQTHNQSIPNYQM